MFQFFTVQLVGTDSYICRVPQDVREMSTIWSEDAQEIKFYPKKGPARAAMTRIVRICKEAKVDPPEIVLVQLDTFQTEINEDDRIKKASDKIAHTNAENVERHRLWRIEALKASMKRAEAELKGLKT